MTEARVVLCTVPDEATAERMARALLHEELAACVNIVPGLTSVYRWKGNIEADPEHLLVIKTRRECVGALKAALPSLHPYEVPELLVLPVLDGHPPYLSWIDESVRR